MAKKLRAEWMCEIPGTEIERFLDKTEVSSCEKAEEEINTMLKKFNSELREGEQPRKLFEIVEIYETYTHEWHKQNLVTQSSKKGQMYDLWVCDVCKKEYKRMGLDFSVALRNEVCEKAQKEAEKKFWDETFSRSQEC